MDSGRHVVSSVVPAITVYSVVWGFFENIDFRSVRCLLCGRHLLKKGCGSTTPINLWRHLSSKHPKVYSELVSTQQHPPTSLNSSQDSNTNPETDEAFWGTEKSDAPGKLPSPLAGALKMSEGERRTLKREIELIEALRRTQKEEARTLEHQRELLEKLRAASARETAAEREQIESLRKAQQEEAKDLSRQREELQKEKEELQKKWDELQQEREELLLFSRGQQVS
uniref:BED-type domain-containing protein n=1 Tax=Oreochromis niloticus TaxID=8128 RepID=A0A669EVS2_ORENI